MGKTRRHRTVHAQVGPSENLKIVAIIFIATTVVGLGTSFMLYTEIRKMEDTIASLKREVENTNQQFNKQLERADKLAKAVFGDPNATADALGDVLKPVLIKIEGADGAEGEGGLEGGAEWQPESLVDLIAKIRRKATSIQENNEVLKGSLEEQRSKYETLQGEMAAVRAAKETEIQNVRSELANERSTSHRIREESEEKIAGLQQRITELRKMIEDLTRVQTQEKEQWLVEKENLEGQLQRLQKKPKPISAIFEFDGEILEADAKLKVATINLGRKEAIRPGFKFEVYPPGIPSEDRIKAMVEVRNVNDHTSTVRVLEDKITDPILPSDCIYSPLYNPRQKELFSLVGEFLTPFTEERVTRLITEHGGRATREVTDETDYMVLGKDYEGQEGYEAGVKLGIEVLRLQTLQRFFGK